ncbi:hypothetical protein B9Q04_16190 [Candidatus Marsarchaeota G2 archaeon BE_D]|jgi:hypothetical protein|uniref:Uncharacterized protein n=1 Tax=Candidatus Marsarchaeota G2 archaeon BE_D TaxID=1978158 RepID=A0A2R6C674_9ARCH|nr:MAG: hypothetical protein B9Q04_16190 [Candidatus Marsarchaeota G2 archaeon BE_D]
MIYEAISALIGVFAGVDPSRGWRVRSLLPNLQGGQVVPASLVVVVLSTTTTTLLTAAPALIALRTHFYTGFLLLAYGVNTLIHGALKAAYPRAHYSGPLKPKLTHLAIWSTINSTLSGYGLPLGALTLIQAGSQPYFYLAYVPVVTTLATASLFRGVHTHEA